MHKANILWWRHCVELYPRWFIGPNRVAEFGSLNVNGSVRQFFSGQSEYIGIDWRKGPNVDLVSLAHKVKLPKDFDTIISASMLEPDPYWDRSIERRVRHLGPRGGLFLSWGAARNNPHRFETAPDGKFHALPAWNVISKVRELGLRVQEFRYEHLSPWLDDDARRKLDEGCVGLVAFMDYRDENPAVAYMDALLPEDACWKP